MQIAPSCNEVAWYAVLTRSRQEKMAASMLEYLEVPHFLPLLNQERQWSDRKQMVNVPLFPGYVFVHIERTSECTLRVLKVPGIVDFIRNGDGPMAIPATEIESVRAALTLGTECSPHPFLRAGDEVRVIRGALVGVEGTLIRTGPRSKLVISVQMIQRSVAISVAECDVESIHRVPNAAA